jgi:hypothetical protein
MQGIDKSATNGIILSKNNNKLKKKIKNINYNCGYKIGDLVSVLGYKYTARVRYIGNITCYDPNEIWLGLEFDQPTGKSDGQIKFTKDG